MNFTVKITTFQSILDLIYPCYCRGCGKMGSSFCFRCYNYNRALNPPFSRALEPDFHKLFVCGLREGVLSDLISDYKFHSRRHYVTVFAKMIAEDLKNLPKDTVVVPLPTIEKHIRSRGFDHIKLLAEAVSKLNGFEIVPLLSRANNTVQVGKDSKTRIVQARDAYKLNPEILPSHLKTLQKHPILLLDDVWTTGASMKRASFLLRSAGFRDIYGVVLAKNDGYDFN